MSWKIIFLQLPLFILQIDASASEKHRLEEKQRAVKKQRELSGEAWTPRYSRFSHTSIRSCSSDSEFIVASETEFQLSRQRHQLCRWLTRVPNFRIVFDEQPISSVRYCKITIWHYRVLYCNQKLLLSYIFAFQNVQNVSLQNHLSALTDCLHCSPSWNNLWRTCSTSETAFFFFFFFLLIFFFF